MKNDVLLTAAQTAERLGLRESTIRKLILTRRIDTVRPTARAVRIPESAVRRILEEGFRPAIGTTKAGN